MSDEEKNEQLEIEMPETDGLPDDTDDIPDESEKEVVDEQASDEDTPDEGESEEETESEEGDELESEEVEDEDEQPVWSGEYKSADEMYEHIKELQDIADDKLAEEQAEQLANEEMPPEMTTEQYEELATTFTDMVNDPKTRTTALAEFVDGLVQSKIEQVIETRLNQKMTPVKQFLAKQQMSDMVDYVSGEIGKKYSRDVIREASKLLNDNPHRRQEADYFKTAINTVLGQPKYRKVAAQKLFDSERSQKAKAKKTSTPKGRTPAPKAKKSDIDAFVDSIMNAEHNGL